MKLTADRAAEHLFISPQDWLRLVEVLCCAGSDLLEFFDAREAGRPYSAQGQQHFGRSIPFSWVRENTGLLLRIEDGEVADPQAEWGL